MTDFDIGKVRYFDAAGVKQGFAFRPAADAVSEAQSLANRSGQPVEYMEWHSAADHSDWIAVQPSIA